jgi:hypothetical protein
MDRGRAAFAGAPLLFFIDFVWNMLCGRNKSLTNSSRPLVSIGLALVAAAVYVLQVSTKNRQKADLEYSQQQLPLIEKKY